MHVTVWDRNVIGASYFWNAKGILQNSNNGQWWKDLKVCWNRCCWNKGCHESWPWYDHVKNLVSCQFHLLFILRNKCGSKFKEIVNGTEINVSSGIRKFHCKANPYHVCLTSSEPMWLFGENCFQKIVQTRQPRALSFERNEGTMN